MKKVTRLDENGDEFEVEEPDYDTYSAASKQFSLVDPKCADRRSLHFAAEDRTYLLVKNKYTGEWEFPVGKVQLNQTFFRAKMKLFEDLTGNDWRIKFTGSAPMLHTLREFSEDEKKLD